MISDPFYWGGAISACQAEGAYDRDGRTPSVFDTLPLAQEGRWDLYKQPQKAIDTMYEYYPSHDAIDFYDHYKEDIALLAEMGINSFRTSISWSRIVPTLGGPVNEKGLQFYKNLFRECRKYDIEPVVTLCHFDTPLYLTEAFDGWKRVETLDFFVAYAEEVMTHLHGLVRYWIPINEINMILHIPYLGGGMVSLEDADKVKAAHHMLCASAKVVELARRIDENNKVGCMLAAGVYYPKTCHPEDVVAAQHENRKAYVFTDVQLRGAYPKWFLDQQRIHISEADQYLLQQYTADYVAISYYTSRLIAGMNQNTLEKVDGNAAATLRNEYLDITPWGRQIDPRGLKTTLIDLYDRYQKPIFIVENGLGMHDELADGEVEDDYRIQYTQEHIAAMKQAMHEGVEVLGYLVWGIIDIISAGGGEMEKRYGMIYIDCDNHGRGTRKRYRKASYYWYKEFIKSQLR